MENYLNKLSTGYLCLGLEASFQHYLSNLIEKELELQTFCKNERFIVSLENNIPINNKRDYIDIVIEYYYEGVYQRYLIELKYKKESDGGVEPGNVSAYIDIYNLDYHRHNTSNIAGCYFVFLTANGKFLEEGKKGTRVDVPMYDGYQITKETKYVIHTPAAKEQVKKTSNSFDPDGFQFNNDYSINYNHIQLDSTKEDLWYFIIKM